MDTYFICEICGYKTDRKYNFLRHKEKQCSIDLFCCNICGRKFTKNVYFLSHKASCKLKYKCELCGQEFTTKRSLSSHRSNRKCVIDNIGDKTVPQSNRIYICQMCRSHFDSIKDYATHTCSKKFLLTANSCIREYLCKICKKVFSDSISFNKHDCQHSTASSDVFVCKVCDENFNNVSGLIYHSKTCNQQEDNSPAPSTSRSSVGLSSARSNKNENVFVCRVCDERFNNVSGLIYHSKTCNQQDDNSPVPSTSMVSSALSTDHSNKNGNVFLCNYCKQEFCDIVAFVKHVCSQSKKETKKQSTLFCNVCNKKFRTIADVISHKRLTQLNTNSSSSSSKLPDDSDTYFCNLCSIFFKTFLEYKSHVCEQFSKKEMFKTRCSICGELFESRQLWYSHRRQVHENIDGCVQQEPWIKANRTPPWVDSDNVIDKQIQQTYEEHASLILDSDFIGRLVSIYNLPLDTNFSIDTIMNKIEEIYSSKNNAFRINISFGVFLRNIKTNAVRYFRPYRCSELFAKPLYVSSFKDLSRFRTRLVNYNIPDYFLKTRPNTEYVPIFAVQARIFVWNLNYALGCTYVAVPKYISKNKGILPMVFARASKRRYRDMLCMFRCLAYHKNKQFFTLNEPVQNNFLHIYFEKWQKFLERYENRLISQASFEGVKLIDLSLFEKCFKINIEVYEMGKKQVSSHVFRSRRSFTNSMNVNLFDGHASYISDFSAYSKKYQCKKCEKMFKTIYFVKRHEISCELCTKIKFPGGMFRPKHDIWKRLAFVGVHVDVTDTFWPWTVAFDCEAMLKEVNISQGNNTLLTHKHEPISVSICSNVTGYDSPHCIVEENFSKLVCRFVRYLDKCTDVIRSESKKKWGWILKTLEKNIARWGGNIAKLETQKETSLLETQKETSLHSFNAKSKHKQRKDEALSSEGTSFQTSVLDSEENEEMGEFMKKKMSRENVYRKMLQNLHNTDQIRVSYEQHDLDSIDSNEFEDLHGSSDDHYDDDDDDEDLSAPTNTNQHETFQCKICNVSECKCVEIRSTVEFFSVFENQQNKKNMVNLLTKLYFDFVLYLNQVVILSFNAKKYDLNLLKKKLIKELQLIDGKNVYVIKKESSYMCIASDRYKFCDLLNWLPPNCSYRKLLKNYSIDEEKLFFPYEYVTDFKKLNDKLPEMNSRGWYSSIHNKSVLADEESTIEDNYNIVQTIWRERGMKTLKDLLIVYNNQDTIGLIKVAEIMQKFYFEDKINIWKCSISLAGIARNMLFREAESLNVYFACISRKQIPMYKMIKDNIFGGASILFKRYCNAGSSYVNGNKSVKCKKIIGFDCTSMYLFCLGEEMPINFPVVRKKETGFSPLLCDIGFMPIFWMDWLSKERGYVIHHRFNSNNQEVRFSNFRVDGFSAEKKDYFRVFWVLLSWT